MSSSPQCSVKKKKKKKDYGLFAPCPFCQNCLLCFIAPFCQNCLAVLSSVLWNFFLGFPWTNRSLVEMWSFGIPTGLLYRVARCCLVAVLWSVWRECSLCCFCYNSTLPLVALKARFIYWVLPWHEFDGFHAFDLG